MNKVQSQITEKKKASKGSDKCQEPQSLAFCNDLVWLKMIFGKALGLTKSAFRDFFRLLVAANPLLEEAKNRLCERSFCEASSFRKLFPKIFGKVFHVCATRSAFAFFFPAAAVSGEDLLTQKNSLEGEATDLEQVCDDTMAKRVRVPQRGLRSWKVLGVEKSGCKEGTRYLWKKELYERKNGRKKPSS